ncbi:hypothetical protein [Nitrincola tapanii]|uniref:Uncharacterized protein n=1 Tax=Nitrincola tapanii TaxID=1708751 RepID=A0A5A9W103_9GAMM|nr:hypothetical protein [Nitrincola tapanii]KAA0874164.1 hypothetical protein E1H14_10340 [Nitrincola tapanii]
MDIHKELLSKAFLELCLESLDRIQQGLESIQGNEFVQLNFAATLKEVETIKYWSDSFGLHEVCLLMQPLEKSLQRIRQRNAMDRLNYHFLLQCFHKLKNLLQCYLSGQVPQEPFKAEVKAALYQLFELNLERCLVSRFSALPTPIQAAQEATPINYYAIYITSCADFFQNPDPFELLENSLLSLALEIQHQRLSGISACWRLSTHADALQLNQLIGFCCNLQDVEIHTLDAWYSEGIKNGP